MAIKITEILIDDIDGAELSAGNGETVRFGLDGVNYEIDLSNENALDLREALNGYIKNARRAGATAPRRTTAGKNTPSELKVAREWLRSQGHTVSDRGRIPASLLAEFRAAN